MVIMTSLQVSYPWLTVQKLFVVRSPFVAKHKGHTDQKVHGRRGYKQGELFDREQFVSREYVQEQEEKKREKEQVKATRDKWEKLGLDEAESGSDEDFMEKLGEVQEVWINQTGGYEPLGDFLDNTFNYKDSKTGIETKVNDVSESYETISIEGDVLDKDGAKIGNFERNISNGVVDHTYFKMDSGKGAGFGSKFYKHLEESYLDAGITDVTIHANIDVGGYAWAKMGYDFSDEYQRDSMKADVEKAYRDTYGREPDEDMYHSWEMASLIGPDGRKIGKETMLGSDWQAYKRIDEWDDTWEAGQAYYESKGL